MIDTDKYEGHTQGHWRRKYNFGQMPFNKADENLIYDAPLLLEEVKRLREGIKKMYADINSISLKKDALMDVMDAFDTSIPTVLTSIKELHKGKEE